MIDIRTLALKSVFDSMRTRYVFPASGRSHDSRHRRNDDDQSKLPIRHGCCEQARDESPGVETLDLTNERIADLGIAAGRRRGWQAPAGAVFYSPMYSVYGVGFFAPGQDHGDGGLGNPWLYFDAHSGQAAGAEVPGTGSAGDIFMQAQFPLHSGRIIGVPGRNLGFVDGPSGGDAVADRRAHLGEKTRGPGPLIGSAQAAPVTVGQRYLGVLRDRPGRSRSDNSYTMPRLLPTAMCLRRGHSVLAMESP